ncbi:YhcB family protein [Litoribacillus peritrichatus]|uniref:Z-ring associated protein G n=1 Tax=Litoribacillus peritrichatus TaxID=718191 RepID=A0ABP7N8F1_9GAMM
MENLAIDWLSYGITFVVGSLIGGLLTLWLRPSDKKTRDLEKQLQENEEKQSEYQDQVTSHFTETAELVADLTHQYKRVYDHLSKGAQKLCPDEQIVQQLSLTEAVADKQLPKEDDEKADEPISYEMPKDYASSSDKNNHGGTLSEDFGLQTKRDTCLDKE